MKLLFARQLRRPRGGRALSARRATVEMIEPRVLHAADLAATALGAGMPAVDGSASMQWQRMLPGAEARAPQPGEALTARPELVVVDLRVPDAEALLAGLSAERDAGRALRVVVLAPHDDPWERIAQALRGDTGQPAEAPLGAIHLIGHGSAGRMMLGGGTLDADGLLRHAGEVAGWADRLAPDADLLLYGCDVASSAAGLQLMESLAALTGTDVAASDDATGSAALGGDFDLERRTGSIETGMLLTTPALVAWQGLLVSTPVADRATVEAGSTVQIGVLANDVPNDGVPVVLDATTPAKGTLTLPGAVAGGQIGYTAPTGWTGTDSFQYLIDDGKRGLVNYWRMEGSPADLFGRASSTTLGTPQYAAGDLGRGMLFSGDDQVQLSGLTSTPAQTLVLRFRMDEPNTSNQWRYLWSQALDSSNDGNNRLQVFVAGEAHFSAVAGDLVVQIGDGSTSAQLNAFSNNAIRVVRGSSVAQNGWHQLTITIDGSGTKVYLDGATTPTASSTIGRSNLNLPTTARIGGHVAGETRNDWRGMIDSVARYNVALTGAQSAALYARAAATQVDVDVTPANAWAPVISQPTSTPSAAVTVAEGQRAVTTIQATDADSASVITYAIAGGADAARFTIDKSSGALSFIDVPDFEQPLDAGADQVYDVIVSASDGKWSDTLTLAVQVTNVREPLQARADGATTTPTQTIALHVLDNDLSFEGGGLRLVDMTAPAAGSASMQTGDIVYTADASTLGNVAMSYLAADVSDRLTHYWRLDGDAVDLMAPGSTPLLVGGVTTTTGRWNQALAFDGSGHALLDDPALGGQGATLSLWFRLDDPDRAHTLLAIGDVRSGSGIEIGLTAGPGGMLQARVRDADDTDDPAALQFGSTGTMALPGGGSRSYAVTDGQWHQVTVVLDPASGTRLYLDGVLMRSDATRGRGAMTTSGPMVLGATQALDPATTLIGALDGVATLGRAMDSTEVAGWFGAPGSPRVGIATVTLTPTEQKPPVFAQPTRTVAIAEGVQEVGTALAQDADLPAQTLTYALLPGGDGAHFSIDAATGALQFLQPPDAEAPLDANQDNVYQFTVQVSDGLSTATQGWTVAITPIDEHAPAITSDGGAAAVSRSVDENLTAIATLAAADPDWQAAPLRWSLTGADAALFTIDAVSGALAWRAAPDAEAPPPDADDNGLYEFTVAVESDGRQATQGWTLQLRSVNDAPPVLTGYGGAAAAHLDVDENATIAASLQAVDGDVEPLPLSWRITGGADQAAFAIDAATNELRFLQPPDRDGIGQDADGDHVYEVTVAVDDGLFSVEQHLRITVRPVEEWAPVVTTADVLQAAENTTLVALLTASDADQPGPTPQTWRIDGGADAHLFEIDPASGRLSFLQAPDFEQPGDQNGDNDFEVTVAVQDAGGFEGRKDLRVRVTPVNEAAPAIVGAPLDGSPLALAVAENDTLVQRFEATDADRPLPGLHWRLDGGGDAARFTIDPATGVLRFAAAPDHEAPQDADGDNVYELAIAVSDAESGGLTTSQALRVTVLPLEDTSPVITTPAAIDVPENTTFVVVPSATDADGAGSTQVWRIDGGVDAARFALDAATGHLAFVAAPDFESPLDADTDGIHEVTLTVTDGAGLSASRTLQVRVVPVNEHDPQIVDAPLAGAAWRLEVDENVAFVRAFGATDADLPAQSLQWSIVGGADGALFTLGAADGQLRLRTPPDHEAPLDADGDNAYEVRIAVTDAVSGGRTTTQDLLVAVRPVDDTAPVITTPASLEVAENTTQITFAAATDADGPASVLTWRIEGGADAALFEVDAASGRLAFRTPPDFEAPQDADGDRVHEVVLGVTDGGGLTDSRLLFVRVTPVNEHAPRIVAAPLDGSPIAWSVDENVTAIGRLVAQDADLPAGPLHWTIDGGADAALFAIDALDGRLSLREAPDHEAPRDADRNNVYDVRVAVADPDGLRTTQDLQVTVLALDDSAPVVTTPAELTVRENETQVAMLAAFDPDRALPTLRWQLGGGADAARFTVDADSGRLAFLQAPDFETPADLAGDNAYEVEVVVTDEVGMQGRRMLNVRVTPVDEHAPSIVSNAGADGVPIAVLENERLVTTLLGTDADAGQPAPAWSIAGGADAALFTIDPVSGVLTFVAVPDHERPLDAGADHLYDVVVALTDSAGSVATQALQVQVLPVDEDPGRLVVDGIGPDGRLPVDEGQVVVARVRLDDSDPPAAAPVFSIAGGADAAHFQIDPATGLLSWAILPDHESPGDLDGDNVYEVVVAVDDGLHLSEQPLQVQLRDVDDTAPQVISNRILVEGARVTWTLEARDADTDLAALRFEVTRIEGARLEWVGAPGQAVTSFLGADWIAGRVRMVVLGAEGGVAPQLVLTVQDASHRVESATDVVALQRPMAPAPAQPPLPLSLSDEAAGAPPAQVPLQATTAPAPVPTLAPVGAEALAVGAPSVAVPGGEPDATRFAARRADAMRIPVHVDGVAAWQFGLAWGDWRLLRQEAVEADMDPGRPAGPARRGESAAQAVGSALAELRSQPVDAGEGTGLSLAAGSMLVAGLSLGYVMWLARGGLLVTSMLSGVPVWAGIDPLPVLSEARRARDGAGEDEGDDEHDEVERLFDRRAHAAPDAGLAQPDAPAPGEREARQAIENARRRSAMETTA